MFKNKRTFIIAEAGVNHNGDIEIAKRLIAAAAQAGADAVKFQTFKANMLAVKFAEKAKYQIENTKIDDTQFSMLQKLELSEEMHYLLKKECEQNGIVFSSSPFDEESVDLLFDLGVTFFKIPSGEITNESYIKHVASKKKPIVLSTGMSNLKEVKRAVDWIESISDKELILLHCVTQYPAPINEINLKAMDTLKNEFKLQVGYSDHTNGIEIALAAAARGANVIEKHFTLDKNMQGPDHKASLEPSELKLMIKLIRNIEISIGDGVKKPAKCELDNIDIARKSIVAINDLPAGHTIKKTDILSKRPGNGIPPFKFRALVGKTLKKPLEADEQLTWDHIE